MEAKKELNLKQVTLEHGLTDSIYFHICYINEKILHLTLLTHKRSRIIFVAIHKKSGFLDITVVL